MTGFSIANAGAFSSIKPKLSPAVLGFEEMTPVQSSAIPLFLQKKDVVVEAVTGSGKTLSFIIPVVEMLLSRETALLKNQVGSIIISPTRELAMQTYSVLEKLLLLINEQQPEAKRIKTQLFIGGNNVQDDVVKYQENGGHIIVGTPGRLDDLIKRSYVLNVKEFEVLILDEADRLLDMGFQATLSSIITKLPKQRRTGLFSATMTDALSELVRAGLRNPVKVSVKVQDLQNNEIKTPSSLSINYLMTKPDEKLLNLIHFLTLHANQKSILYFCTCACVDYFYKIMVELPELKKFQLFALHGKMEAKKREKVYTGFTEAGAPSILICTDVAARGLDIPDVDWVIQYDPPQDPQAFNHRCGRTARMGREGNAIVFLTASEDAYIEFLEIRKVPVEEYQFPTEDANSSFTLTKEALCTTLQDICIADREYYEKSLKAFVSWVRSYNEHHAKFIFKFSDVDLVAVAVSFGMLHLPKMPEIKSKKIEYVGRDIRPNTIAFKDKIREKQRLIKLNKMMEIRALNLEKKHKKETIAWSDQKDTKQKKLDRKEKKVRRKEAILKAKEAGTFTTEKTGKRTTIAMSEWEELQADARKAKKAKKAGKEDVLSSDDDIEDDDSE